MYDANQKMFTVINVDMGDLMAMVAALSIDNKDFNNLQHIAVKMNELLFLFKEKNAPVPGAFKNEDGKEMVKDFYAIQPFYQVFSNDLNEQEKLYQKINIIKDATEKDMVV